MRRLAAILAFVAIVLSGGGVARALHLALAHGGTGLHSTLAGLASPIAPCSHAHHSTCPLGATTRAGEAANGVSSVDADDDPAPGSEAVVDHCPTCVELAFNLLTPPTAPVAATFVTMVTALVEPDLPSAPRPRADRTLAARPPPQRA